MAVAGLVIPRGVPGNAIGARAEAEASFTGGGVNRRQLINRRALSNAIERGDLFSDAALALAKDFQAAAVAAFRAAAGSEAAAGAVALFKETADVAKMSFKVAVDAANR